MISRTWLPGPLLLLCLAGCRGLGGGQQHSRLLRCIYAVPAGAQALDLDLPVPAPLPLPPSPPAAAGPAVGPALRTYEVVELDPGSPTIVVVEPEGAAALPGIAALRQLAFGALRGSMAPPRRALDWHFEALAGFLASEPPLLTSLETASLLERWSAAADHQPLAAIIYASALRFDAAQVARLAGHERVGPRLLGIVRRGLEGSRDSVAELLRLSLEHYGDLRIFDAALRALFPARLNVALHREHPPSSDPAATIAFLRHVHERLGAARHAGGAWTLEGSS